MKKTEPRENGVNHKFHSKMSDSAGISEEEESPSFLLIHLIKQQRKKMKLLREKATPLPQKKMKRMQQLNFMYRRANGLSFCKKKVIHVTELYI